MLRYIAWRLVQIVPVLWAVGTALFLLLQATPGGPIVALTGEFADRDTVVAIERRLGLDRPLHEQYLPLPRASGAGRSRPLLFLQGAGARRRAFAPTGDPHPGPPIPCPCRRHRHTARHSRRTRRAPRASGCCSCRCWPSRSRSSGLATCCALSFPSELGWFPIQGMVDARRDRSGFDLWLDVARHAVLPVATLTLHQLAFTVLLTRSAMTRRDAAAVFRHRPRQGQLAVAGGSPPRPAQRLARHRHPVRQPDRLVPGRRGAHRDRVRLAWPRPARERGDAEPRLPSRSSASCSSSHSSRWSPTSSPTSSTCGSIRGFIRRGGGLDAVGRSRRPATDAWRGLSAALRPAQILRRLRLRRLDRPVARDA